MAEAEFSYEKKMYEETGCSEPNSMSTEATTEMLQKMGFPEQWCTLPLCPHFLRLSLLGGQESHGSFDENLNLSMEKLSYYHHRSGAGGDAMELEFQQQQAAAAGFNNSNINPNFGQEVTSDLNRMVCFDRSNWVGTKIQEMGFNHQIQSQDPHQQFSDSAMAAAYSQAPDLLNFFNMPATRCPNAFISFSNNTISNLHNYTMGRFLTDLPAGDVSNKPSSTSLSIGEERNIGIF